MGTLAVLILAHYRYWYCEELSVLKISEHCRVHYRCTVWFWYSCKPSGIHYRYRYSYTIGCALSDLIFYDTIGTNISTLSLLTIGTLSWYWLSVHYRCWHRYTIGKLSVLISWYTRSWYTIGTDYWYTIGTDIGSLSLHCRYTISTLSIHYLYWISGTLSENYRYWYRYTIGTDIGTLSVLISRTLSVHNQYTIGTTIGTLSVH